MATLSLDRASLAFSWSMALDLLHRDHLDPLPSEARTVMSPLTFSRENVPPASSVKVCSSRSSAEAAKSTAVGDVPSPSEEQQDETCIARFMVHLLDLTVIERSAEGLRFPPADLAQRGRARAIDFPSPRQGRRSESAAPRRRIRP